MFSLCVDAGYHTVQFDASGLASGVHYYRLIMPETTFTKKMLLVG